LWLGSASFDRGVGVSHDTGQITHHIGPDLDAERELVIGDLKAAGQISMTFERAGVGATRDGRNGGGDPYFTDGRILVGVLRSAEKAAASDRSIAIITGSPRSRSLSL
ncbi:LssY C-terminal domain-containing protein, partial [Rhizobium leguminosarum]